MKKKKIISGVLISLLVLLLLGSSIAYAEHTPPIPGAPTYINIDVEKAQEMLEGSPEQIILLDVRTEDEYNAEHISGAINIPLSELETRIGELDKSKTIVVYCRTGDISREASEILVVQHGFELVYNMLGGIEAWREKSATSISTPKLTQTPAPTLSPTVTLTLSPAASPALVPAASPSLIPTSAPVTTPTPAPEEEERWIPGFEASLAILILLILFMLLRRKKAFLYKKR